MVCKYCGKEIQDGADVCEFCGAELSDEIEKEENVEETVETVEETIEEIADTDCQCDGECSCEDEFNCVPEDECGCCCDGDDECCCEDYDESDECDCCCECESAGKKSSKLRTVLIIGISVLAVAAAVIACYIMGVFQSPAVKTVNNFYNAVASGDGKTVYELTTDAYEIKAIVEQGKFKSAEEISDLYVEQYKQIGDMFKEQYGQGIEVESKTIEITKYSEEDVTKVSKYLNENQKYPEDALKKIVVIKSEQTIRGEKGGDIQISEDLVFMIDGIWYYGGAGSVIDVESLGNVIAGEVKGDTAK